MLAIVLALSQKKNRERGVKMEGSNTNTGQSLDEWNEATAETISVQELDALVAKVVELKTEVDEKQAIADEVQARLESEKIKLLSMLKSANKKSYKVDGLALISVTQTPQVAGPQSLTEKEAFFEYLRAKGHGIFMGLVSVNSRTLNSWYKDEFEAYTREGKIGFKIPGLAEPTVRESLSIRKDKKK